MIITLPLPAHPILGPSCSRHTPQSTARTSTRNHGVMEASHHSTACRVSLDTRRSSVPALNGQSYLARRAPPCACVSCPREGCEHSTKGNGRREADGNTGVECIRIGSGHQATQSRPERRNREAEEGRHHCAARDEPVVRVHELPAQALPCVQRREERTSVHCQVSKTGERLAASEVGRKRCRRTYSLRRGRRASPR